MPDQVPTAATCARRIHNCECHGSTADPSHAEIEFYMMGMIVGMVFVVHGVW